MCGRGLTARILVGGAVRWQVARHTAVVQARCLVRGLERTCRWRCVGSVVGAEGEPCRRGGRRAAGK
jgi:hypothetical protein